MVVAVAEVLQTEAEVEARVVAVVTPEDMVTLQAVVQDIEVVQTDITQAEAAEVPANLVQTTMVTTWQVKVAEEMKQI